MKTAVVTMTGRPGPDRSSLDWREAFCKGLKARGWKAEMSTSPKDCDLLVLWGIRRSDAIARQKAAGGEVCILERGYIGDRFANTSVSFGGGLNGRGEFRGPFDDGSRFDNNFAHLMRDWKRVDGGHALIIGQVPGDNSIKHTNIDEWYNQSADALKRAGYAKVYFRPHPKAHNTRGPRGIPEFSGNLHEAMDAASVVMTFNSNTGVEAALYGRPVITMDRGSMAWDVASHQVDGIVTPDRSAWAKRLAWCQFTKDEMQSGFCAEMVGL